MTVIRALWPVLAIALVLSQPGGAWMMFSADAPDTGLSGNSFVDILYHEGTIWLASGRGLSYSTNMGLSWYTRTTETNPGLSSDAPSALFGRTGQIWMAGSHFELFEGINYPFGDGLSMSTDNGEVWETYTPPEASSFAKLVYDISGTDSMIYAACFHGGMIVRHDPDTVWEHVFYSPADSLDWDADQWADLASGRYFSCAVDTTHADTLILYGGSARGINKFVYLPKRVKLGGKKIYDIAAAGKALYLAHEAGITQVYNDTLPDSTIQERLYTADATNGLGADWIKGLFIYGGKLWAAAFDPTDSTGLTGNGLYYLENPETEWVEIGQQLSGQSDLWFNAAIGEFYGVNGGVFDFNVYEYPTQSVFFIAAGDSGVFYSNDSGQIWNRLFVDPLNTNLSDPKNQVYSIDLTADSLFLGTRAGLIVASYTSANPYTFDFNTLYTFPEDDTSGSWVSFVRHLDDDSASFTYVGLEPQTDLGNSSVHFLDPKIDPIDSSVSMRGTALLYHTSLYDLIIDSNLTVIASSFGLFFSLNYPTNLPPFFGEYDVVDHVSGLTLDAYEFLSAEFIGDRFYTGTTGGYGIGVRDEDEALVWTVSVANTNPRKHDLASAITNAGYDLPGDWIVALDIQNYDTGAVLWAACRRVPDTVDQINAVSFTTDYGNTWQQALPNEQVWNFAFDDNGTVYAAASEGLFAADTPWVGWQRLPIIDPVTQDTIAAETEIFCVAVVEDIIWVGTELGLARRNIDPDSSWNITRIYKPTESDDEIFAAPVPYSPLNNNGRLSIHYHVPQSCEVTVEIYDFAMNLVKSVTENRSRAGGSDYFETWDGYNGRGDMVAIGVYYIKVSYSTGETQWGRLAIIP